MWVALIPRSRPKLSLNPDARPARVRPLGGRGLASFVMPFGKDLDDRP